jgi:sulfate-transporting ATPase
MAMYTSRPVFSVGHLEQEPDLDETKTVIDIVREGVQPIMDLLKEYEDVNNKFADEEVLERPG